MKDKKKSLIEESLADFKLIENTLTSNSKEILRSFAKEEITSALNESLHEDEYEIEDIEDIDGGETVDGDVNALPVADSPEVGAPDLGGAPEMGGAELGGAELGGSEELGIDDMGIDAVDGGLGLGAEEGSDDYDMDMTGASDEDVISVYKKLSGEDEIEVVSDSEVIIKDPVSGAEYNVKLGGGSMLDQGEMGVDGGFDVEPEMGIEAPEAEVAPEIGIEAEPEGEVGVEPEAPSVEAEFDADSAETEKPESEEAPKDEEDEEEEMGESVVYEVELSEEDEITEETKIGNTAQGKTRTATSDVENLGGTSLPTGDIEGQKAEKDKEIKGDNLDGGFVEKANGTGDNHADHIMEEDDARTATSDVNSKGGTMPTGDIEGQKAPVVLPEGEEAVEESEIVEESEVIDEEIVEEEDTIEEKIQVGKGRNVTNNKTSIVGAGGKANNVKAPNVTVAETAKKYNALLSEAKKLKEENEMFRTSLKGFRKMLGETAVYNSNLTYVTKLFLEHSTTGGEKKQILERFDNEVTTIEESKKLYKSIVSELGSKKPIAESVESKIVSEQSTSQSTQLNEMKVYVDPTQSRIIDLMNRTKNR